MKYVVFYEVTDEGIGLIPFHMAEHRVHWKAFAAAGTLLMVGPFANPRDGAMGVFKTREAAEAFATGDPFVRHGVVKKWRIMEWMEAVGPSRGDNVGSG
jgi:uncharacterized protein YciI